MPRRSQLVYLQEMLEWSREALNYCEHRTLQAIEKDTPGQSHLIRALSIIGEAAGRISPQLRGRHPEIPWQGMIAMRNILIHAYWDVDMAIVWKTASEMVPDLIPRLENLIALEQQSEQE